MTTDFSITNLDGMMLLPTFTCGQAFRFHSLSEQAVRGVYAGAVLTLTQEGDRLRVSAEGRALTVDGLRAFLDLDRPYQKIHTEIIRLEPRLEAAVRLGEGIRIIRQEPLEALVSFILSSNSNMKRIQKHIEGLSAFCGSTIKTEDGGVYFAFPTLEQLKTVGLADFQEMGFGYRAPYLYDAISGLESMDDLERLNQLETPQLLEALTQIKGIGGKVAGCIALFGFGRHEAFPVDVWIKRYFMWELNEPHLSIEKMVNYGKTIFGPYAGITQQVMFYYMLNKYK